VITEGFVIGVDDTDSAESGGTGALVRALGAKARADGIGDPEGVTRHALWTSDKVHSTGDNQCYALVLRTDRSVLDVEDFVVDFVRAEAEREADPGIAILSRHSDMPHILAFGRRSQQELMRLDWAQTFSTEANVALRALGRERAGAVGALAAAGLRAGGGDGYFIDLEGLREIEGRITAGQIRELTAIEHVLDQDNAELDRDDLVETFNWVRPHLEDGQPVLHTTRSSEEPKLWLLNHRRPASATNED
jgi:hypothetical protein